jgi:IS30 family transposase
MKYCRLTPVERYQIEAGMKSGFTRREIARRLNRNVSTISREVRKTSIGTFYVAEEGQSRSLSLRRHRISYKIKGPLEEFVREKLLMDWSPEQITGRMDMERDFAKVSRQTIYRYIFREKARGGTLWKHLRILRKQRQDRKKPGWKACSERLTERTWITARPEVVKERSRIGDYERDTVFGKFGKSLLLSLVDRTSRLTKLAWLPRKCSWLTHLATVESLQGEVVHTITNDNGIEFIKHEATALVLNANVYFSHAYRSWERGTNENTNGLLRQYFPKSKDIGQLAASDLKRIEEKLNNRPRKCLGFKTPLEVHTQMTS